MMRKLLAVIGLLLFSVSPALAANKTATLSVQMDKTSVAPNETVTASIILATGAQEVIGTIVKITISPNLSYLSFDAKDSVFNTEIDQPTIDGNTITFSRIDTTTSYSGEAGLVAKLTFTAKEVGNANVTISETDSQVKADSDLSNILKSVQNAQITISTTQATATPKTSTTPTPTATKSPTPKPTTTVSPSPKPSIATTATLSPLATNSPLSSLFTTPSPTAPILPTPIAQAVTKKSALAGIVSGLTLMASGIAGGIMSIIRLRSQI